MSVRAAVEEHVAAFNAHDTARLLAGFTPDAVWIPGEDAVSGRAGLAEFFDDWLWSMQPQLKPLTIVVEGDRAAAQLRESMLAHGQFREFSIAVFFEVVGGLIKRAKVYREGSAEL